MYRNNRPAHKKPSVHFVALIPAKIYLLFLMWVYGIFLSACLPGEPVELPPTLSPTPSTTPTLTPVWFPPTDTPTPFPTIGVTPTQNQRPGIGEILFADDFSRDEGWGLLSSPRGNITLGANELTLAVLQPRAYLSAIRDNPILGDFYAEITTNASICSGFDEYGILIRVASPVDFYRFSLSCNGNVRLDRLYKGVASSPQPWMFTSAVPSAAPSTSRLAVWAVDKEMRFFVNDQYQFTITDPILLSGSIGVFARSSGENAVTINFSDLVVRRIAE